MSFKALIFQKFATEARDKLLQELKQTYESKKGDRFKVKNITYEISRIAMNKEGMEFEISSKIPLEDLPQEAQLKQFFEEVKRICGQDNHPPFHAGMDDIVHKLGEREVKKRDYVRLHYRYKFEELYDSKDILWQTETLSQESSVPKLPDVPGVTSLSGRLVLLAVRDNVYRIVKDKVDNFIKANEQVRAKLRG